MWHRIHRTLGRLRGRLPWLSRHAPGDEPRELVRRLLPVWPWVLVLLSPALLPAAPRYPGLVAFVLAFLGGFGLGSTQALRRALYDYLARARRARQGGGYGSGGEATCIPIAGARLRRGAWLDPVGPAGASGSGATIVH